ncbi:MAG: 2-(1,2-epoxy-1,2-dihydrophenyl)acetyl-CoA isomerase PaaG [Gemmatimonadaceae bacterium]|nr:2-(1,2-epoxy-1,2-dihydrophenyl)acetyl-CoA isomerase PaaG [Gemmatimonadaceae bacterium]
MRRQSKRGSGRAGRGGIIPGKLAQWRRGCECRGKFPRVTPTHLIVSQADGVTSVTLNRPDLLNSFNRAMAAEFLAVIAAVAADPAQRALYLTGAGRAFCAGQDLAEAMPQDGGALPDLGDFVRDGYNPIVKALRTLEKPVICAVNGVAAGAGANLAFCCDIVVAAEEAVFIQSFSKIGVVPDTGGTFILPRLVGLARATALTMLADKLSASKAKEWGLIYEVAPAATLHDTAYAIAKQLATQPTRALGMIKRGFNASLGITLDDALANEESMQREAGATADYAEGVRAFLEKRKPRFTGQ